MDDGGRRLAAFGFWAGYLGAALAVLHHRGGLRGPAAADLQGGDWRPNSGASTGDDDARW